MCACPKGLTSGHWFSQSVWCGWGWAGNGGMGELGAFAISPPTPTTPRGHSGLHAAENHSLGALRARAERACCPRKGLSGHSSWKRICAHFPQLSSKRGGTSANTLCEVFQKKVTSSVYTEEREAFATKAGRTPGGPAPWIPEGDAEGCSGVTPTSDAPPSVEVLQPLPALKF